MPTNPNNPIKFSVPAVPIAQPRQRHRIVKAKGRTFTSNYTPASDPVNAFKAVVAMAAREAYGGPPLDVPLTVSMVFIMPRGNRPSWLTNKRFPRWFAAWKDGQRVPYAVKKNDRDNLMKGFQDALNGLLWTDDGLICAGPVEKWIAAADEQAHVEVVVEELD